MNNIDKKMLNGLIRTEAVSESIEILTNCSETRFNEFLTYHNVGKGNLCCLVLDVAKSELVENGQILHSEEDWFGSPYLKTNNKI